MHLTVVSMLILFCALQSPNTPVGHIECITAVLLDHKKFASLSHSFLAPEIIMQSLDSFSTTDNIHFFIIKWINYA